MGAPRARPAPGVPACRGEQDGERGEHQQRADDDAVDPALVGHERQAHEQERDEREDVEATVEHDRREPAAERERSPRHPPCAQKVADATGQHVVDRDSRHDHLDEAPLPEPRVGDAPPPGRLEPVDGSHARHRTGDRDELDVLERAPHGAEVGAADREEQEDQRDRDPDRSRDEERAAAPGAGHVGERGGPARAHDGRVGDDGHVRRIVRRHVPGLRRGSKPTLAHRPVRISDPRAIIHRCPRPHLRHCSHGQVSARSRAPCSRASTPPTCPTSVGHPRPAHTPHAPSPLSGFSQTPPPPPRARLPASATSHDEDRRRPPAPASRPTRAGRERRPGSAAPCPGPGARDGQAPPCPRDEPLPDPARLARRDRAPLALRAVDRRRRHVADADGGPRGDRPRASRTRSTSRSSARERRGPTSSGSPRSSSTPRTRSPGCAP